MRKSVFTIKAGISENNNDHRIIIEGTLDNSSEARIALDSVCKEAAKKGKSTIWLIEEEKCRFAKGWMPTLMTAIVARGINVRFAEGGFLSREVFRLFCDTPLEKQLLARYARHFLRDISKGTVVQIRFF